ncbi:MAG: hypothetical protein Ct9H300mP14_01650 [Gammaproteobacteria bacterium]|nr:MAG: hypothetical protein Ct9H300mP14_01650 [Gammaproteobacteria bacterium]
MLQTIYGSGNFQDVGDPKTVIEEHPLPPSVAQLVTRTRAEAHAILHGQDDRVIVIVGPCSIHDPVAALGYGARLERYGRVIPKTC